MTMQDKITTVNEAIDSLTGYDEAAIEEKFGADVYALTYARKLRALVWADKRRAADVSDDQAYEAVMTMRAIDVVDFFGDDEDDEIDPDFPETPAGEGDSSSD